MKQTCAISYLNFKQATRDKIFSGILFFFACMLVMCAFLATLSIGETQKVIRSTGITGLEISGILLVLFSLTLNFFKESDTRIIEVYLSYFSRRSYLYGKLLGYFAVCFLYLFIGGLGWSVILYLYDALSLAVLGALYALFWKLAIIATINLLFCVVFSSPLIAFLATIFVYYVSEICTQAAVLALKSGSVIHAQILQYVSYILPNMALLDLKSHAAYAEVVDLNMLAIITLYSVVYIAFILTLTHMLFTRKEL